MLVPRGLKPGRYVLSFRWDCEHTPQVSDDVDSGDDNVDNGDFDGHGDDACSAGTARRCVAGVVAIVLIVTMMIMKMVIMMIRPIAGLEWLRKYSNHKLVHSDIMLEREILE